MIDSYVNSHGLVSKSANSDSRPWIKGRPEQNKLNSQISSGNRRAVFGALAMSWLSQHYRCPKGEDIGSRNK